ncbi:MAG: hypothetical protein DRJ01_03490 [Bacteroidetes bacterium]|nr:MAG: hypothetical protein DRJ01_03490 [Bacteroidota bacterium]
MKTSSKLLYILLFGFILQLFSTKVYSQTYEEWLKQQKKEFADYKQKEKENFAKFVKERDEYIQKLDKEYSDYLKQEWKKFDLFVNKKPPAKPKPVGKPVYKPEQAAKVVNTIKVEKPVAKPTVKVPPKLPIVQKSEAEKFPTRHKQFRFYGKNVAFDYDQKFLNTFPSKISEQVISENWDKMAKINYNHLINKMLEYKSDMNLNDWGYYLLIKKAAKQIAPGSKNAATFVEWFLLIKSNYKARLAYKNNSLYLLLPSVNNIYGVSFFTFNNVKFYLIDAKQKDVFTYKKDFPEANVIMDLDISSPINTAENIKEKSFNFNYEGQDYPIKIKYNQNSIDFYKDYPLSDIKVYFDAAVSTVTKETLAEQLLPLIKDKSETEAVSLLLNFVQTAFAYKTDQQQFGKEKFYFPDELFYYPYSDCEDRSVLFSYLVRQLLDIDVIGLNYPGHMSTAVKFSENVEGDYVNYKGQKYIICDATYVNAPIGRVMPQFKDVAAKVVELNNHQNLAEKKRKIWDLVYKAGGNHGSNGQDIVFDKEGNAYVTGYFKGEATFGKHNLKSTNNTNDIFIAKYNKNGEVEYAYKVGGQGNDIAYGIELDDNNCYYVTGSFNKDIKFGSHLLKVKSFGDVFLAKLSAKGGLKWVSQAGIEALDSINNIFMASFNPDGKRISYKVYNESETFNNYGVSIDSSGIAYLTGSLTATTGLSVSNVSFNDYTAFNPITTLKTENDKLISQQYNKSIAGLFAVIHLINNSGISLPGKMAQNALDKYNPSFKKASPNIYDNIGRVQFLKNSQGVVTIRTDNSKAVYFDAVKISNNSKFKVSSYNSGNAVINILSGISVGKAIIWYDLNFIKLLKDTGDIVFDYDSDHTQKKVNLGRDILD